MDNTDLAYMAGILDGEGSVTICSTSSTQLRCKLRVVVSNTDYSLMEWIKERFGGSFHVSKSSCNKPCYAWEVSANKASAFLKLMYPYMIIKREQAYLGMQYQSYKTSERKKILSMLCRNNTKFSKNTEYPEYYFDKQQKMRVEMKLLNGQTIN